MHRTVDPLGGSWFVEALTDQMDHDASAIIREIDEFRAQGLGSASWLSPQRADDVRAVVRDVLSDASTRDSLQTASATAGWKNGFFIASADGNYSMTIRGSTQIRCAFDHRDSSTEINLRRQCH